MSYVARSRKPFVPIDTCSPGGTWIEEKRYNKGRRGSGVHGARKVLCGNWQEEKALEDDLLAQPGPESVIETAKAEEENNNINNKEKKGEFPAGDFTATAVLRASLDVLRVGPGGRHSGGFPSSPYLTADARAPHERLLQTTHRHDFCESNADVRRLRRPEMGVRSRVLLDVALEAARAEKAARDAELQERLTRIAEDGGGVYLSTYHVAHCREEELPVIDTLRNDYLADEPITLYTGNPETGRTMTVHGKTPVEPVEERSQFGRHTYFTERKYTL